MLNRYTSAAYLYLVDPKTFGSSFFSPALSRSAHRRRVRSLLSAPLGLSPLATPTTPGQVEVKTLYTDAAVRARTESWRRRPRSSAVYPPALVVGSSLPVMRSPSSPSALGGGIVHPAPVLIASPPWRFVVVYMDPTAPQPAGSGGKNGAVVTFLDRIATSRTITYELNMPAQAQGTVDGDNPEVYLRTDKSAGYDGEPYLAEGNRLLYGFRREGGYDPDTGAYAPWVCRFGGIILQIEDAPVSDQPKSTFTAFDPWMALFNRPVVNKDGTLPGRDGLSSTNPDFPTNKGGDIALELLKRTIQYHGPIHLDAGVPYGGTAFYGSGGASLGDTDPIDILFQQGCSVGEAWKQLCDTSTMDIALRPIYDPVNRPGYTSELAIHRQLGQQRDTAIFAWDLPSRSLLSLDRLEDGTQRVNVAQFFTQGGVPVLPPAIDGVAPLTEPGSPSQDFFGEYWGLQTLTGQTSINAAASIIYALMLATVKIRRLRSTTIRLDPAPARAPVPLTEYNLGDYVPIYASKRLRKPIPSPDLSGGSVPRGRIYKIPIVLDDDGVETVQQLEFSADQLENIE